MTIVIVAVVGSPVDALSRSRSTRASQAAAKAAQAARQATLLTQLGQLIKLVQQIQAAVAAAAAAHPAAAPVATTTTTTVAPDASRSTTTTTTPRTTTTTTAPAATGTCSKGPVTPPGYYASATVSGLPTLDVPWVSSFGSTKLVAYAGVQYGSVAGFPLNTGQTPPLTQVYLGAWSGTSDPGPYPTPGSLKYEGYPMTPLYDGIQLTVTPSCTTYELIGVSNLFGLPPMLGSGLIGPWKADGGAVWDAAYTPHAAGNDPWHGAPAGVDGARVPLAPLVVTSDEVASGVINHALHWYGVNCRGGARVPGASFVWPARSSDCSSTVDPSAPPYGAWFRLPADYPETGLDPQALAVVRALKTHGMILGDGGGVQAGLALDSQGWHAAALQQLDNIPLSAFQAVDTSSLRADPSAGLNSPDYWLTHAR